MIRSAILCACLCGAVSSLAAQDGHTVFAPAVHYPAARPTDVAAADLDGDGDVDLVVSEFIASGPLRLFNNDGSGTFTWAGIVPQTQGVVELELADLTGDGEPDLLLRQGLELSWLPGLGNGSFGAKTVLLTGTNTFEVAISDVDGDLDLDLVVAISGSTAVPAQGVQLLMNDGSGGFSPGDFVAEPAQGAQWAETADLNGDGLLDLVYATYFPVHLYAALATAPGVFGTPYPIHDQQIFVGLLSTIEFFALADVTGDGQSDVLWPDVSDFELMVLVGDGNGLFSAPVASPMPMVVSFGTSLLVAELNGHGQPEVLITSDVFERAVVMTGPGDGSFVVDVICDGLPRPEEPLLADIDGDSDLDLVLIDDTHHELSVVRNATYLPGSPFTDLGFALSSGATGHPLVLASGAPVAGQTLSYALHHAAPSAAAAMFLGVSTLHAPFKGGVLVPHPDAVYIPLLTSAGGELTLSATWPLGPGSYSFWSQFWIVDAGGPVGFTASTAVRTDVP